MDQTTKSTSNIRRSATSHNRLTRAKTIVIKYDKTLRLKGDLMEDMTESIIKSSDILPKIIPSRN